MWLYDLTNALTIKPKRNFHCMKMWTYLPKADALWLNRSGLQRNKSLNQIQTDIIMVAFRSQNRSQNKLYSATSFEGSRKCKWDVTSGTCLDKTRTKKAFCQERVFYLGGRITKFTNCSIILFEYLLQQQYNYSTKVHWLEYIQDWTLSKNCTKCT